MITIAALYPRHPGSRFDADYYHDCHTPFALELLAPHGLVFLRISEGLAGLDGSPPPFWMISEMRFVSREAFDRAMAMCGAALFADAPHYTDVEPVLQVAAESVELALPTGMETPQDA